MGGAIARGLAADPTFNTADITVCAPNRHQELDALKAEFPEMTVSTDNKDAVLHTDMIIVAVKPWLLATIIDEIAPVADFSRQTLVSIVAGVSCSDILGMLPGGIAPAGVVRVIPNTAIAVMESVNFVTFKDTPQERQDALLKVLEPEVRGAVVLCEGGGNPAVREAVVAAVRAALALPAYKISVHQLTNGWK